MQFNLTFDPAKNTRNIQLRDMDFKKVADFDWSTAVISEDMRKDYSERRYQAVGFVEDHLCMLVFTPRDAGIHVISFRRANKRERTRYATQTKS